MSVIFDQLRISDDGTKMYINAHVNNADYFKDVYIDSITIMTSDKVSESSPEVPTSDYVYTQKIEGSEKELNLMLTASDFIRTWKEDPSAMMFKQGDMCSTLFFVYIKCKGVPASDTPCTLDEEITLGVTFWENMLYRKVMAYTKELADKCSVPTEFKDFILKWNAFKASVETEHYISAIKFFNMMFEDMTSATSSRAVRGCRCYG